MENINVKIGEETQLFSFKINDESQDINVKVGADSQELTVIIDGTKGDKGLSAYDIALKNGFQGTEIQWLISLNTSPNTSTNTIPSSTPNINNPNSFIDLIAKAGNINGIGGHRIVYIDNNSLVQYSTNLNINICNRTIGMTLNSAVYLSNCEIVTTGFIKDSSFSFIIDKPIYLIDNGIISQVYPINAPVCKLIGFALSTDSFWLDIKQSIILGI